ncbi:HAD family hydrolase [bacterium]|nr:HAD family hydrolase [bacterium]RQV93724.1 MAG: HAD family hydrolase [bacterium]
MKLLLFDIDGTLIRTAGAGKVSMERSFEDVFGIGNGFHNIHMMGRTDPSILMEALSSHHLGWDEEKADRFRETYFSILKNEIQIPRPGKRVCPGVRPLLRLLDKRSDIILGLLTGNWQQSAMIKLGYFKIDHYFTMGAFADDSSDRNELVPIAIERLKKEQKIQIQKQNVYVIGDTPLDIHCAKPYGVRTMAVATGFHSFQDLASEKPDYLFHNFKQPEEVLRIFS